MCSLPKHVLHPYLLHYPLITKQVNYNLIIDHLNLSIITTFLL